MNVGLNGTDQKQNSFNSLIFGLLPTPHNLNLFQFRLEVRVIWVQLHLHSYVYLKINQLKTKHSLFIQYLLFIVMLDLILRRTLLCTLEMSQFIGG